MSGSADPAGCTNLTYTTTSAAAANPFKNGDKVCVLASTTQLQFKGKTLTSPKQNTAVTSPYSAWGFTDGGLYYEVVFNGAAIYEINVLAAGGSPFYGQLAASSASATSTSTSSISCDTVSDATASPRAATSAEVSAVAATYNGKEGATTATLTANAAFVFNGDGTASYKGVAQAIQSICYLPGSGAVLLAWSKSGGAGIYLARMTLKAGTAEGQVPGGLYFKAP